ncbi:aspartate-semialdehyde dehydrogenase [Sporosarcina sp. P21c]|uniref:aspartate-semialdehyde dehydrogenase n=1 Tax=Sporosarcina TaxID=1569 RepID=UPI000A15EEE3|nr:MULTISPECIES: aspartate-semialdehyde dehydrogenase [Sporosarcina]ARJ40081.1 aspartate-semialdehyde dehydrogenase [Sporosarcina ureae]PIC68722.1 aspartate-semialdehyde dehydrogenase [Sporosarcina sp. P16a]PIC84506.1 aspartate-semialdehyde dehydrogenase [Sporosarcina sp. P1]PIC91095.1 aspartate-semialdehyde dehydrogenase [Sporosarcina sp. P21c]PIC93774.1 aspartate-semialdehyde dehydrogenase [Sporosarcina sp. P25]
MKNVTVAIVGATGAVGTKILEKLVERNFPATSIKLLASKRSAGNEIIAGGKTYIVQETTPEAFEGIDIAFFSAGGSISEKFAHDAVKSGAVVIDNTSAFRMDPNTPLVVPEVNPQELKNHSGIIANPNCSTIQMVAALKPIKDQYGLSKLIVSTYQAVSGAGVEAIDELAEQSKKFTDRSEIQAEVLPSASAKRHYPIAFNAIPQIDSFDESGYTLEELKMINETKKIFGDQNMAVAATCVRLPVVSGHSESVYIEIDQDNVTVKDIQSLMRNAEGIVLQDDPASQLYPMPLYAEDKDEVFVGRIRKDLDNPKGFHLWIVSDNLLKGAALNSVQIAEALIK